MSGTRFIGNAAAFAASLGLDGSHIFGLQGGRLWGVAQGCLRRTGIEAHTADPCESQLPQVSALDLTTQAGCQAAVLLLLILI